MKHHSTRRVAAGLIATVAMLSCIPAASAAEATNMRCEYLAHPLSIDVAKPRLSWIIGSDRCGEVQTGYQVLVASTPELLAKDGKLTADVSSDGVHLTEKGYRIWAEAIRPQVN